MSTFRVLSSLTLLALSATALGDLSASPSGVYVADKNHAYITFSYSHFGFSTPQVGFDSFDAELNLDSDNVENSSIAVMIDATSISSRVDEFDEHLNSDDFFDTAQFPEIAFRSTSIESTGNDSYDVTGDLTIKGITRPLTLSMTVNKAANHPMSGTPVIGISGDAALNRSDFDLGLYAPNVGDEVSIHVTAEMVKSDD